MAENYPLRITNQDIADANRLSLSCPICASAVEKNPELLPMTPVVCAMCKTLYHRVCWEQNDNSCATLGCAHERCYEIGAVEGPLLKVRYSDLPTHIPQKEYSPNGRFKEKAKEKLGYGGLSDGFWGNLLVRIMRAVGWR